MSSTDSLDLPWGTESMAERPPKDTEEGVKRFLKDFRSHTDRRSFEERRVGDRRSGQSSVEDDRRDSDDRRDRYDRRETLLDRRRGTPEQFIREHVEWIRGAVRNTSMNVACPRCEGDLLLGPTIQRGELWVREVHCTSCRHHTIIHDVPQAPDEGGTEG